MALAFDEFGRPFIIPPEELEQNSRPRGLNAAQKANIAAAGAVALARIIVHASLEPKHYYTDKMLQSPDGDVTITNDGATVPEQIDVDSLMTAKLIEMYRGQDLKIVHGDGEDDVGADADVDGGAEAPTVGGDEAVVATAPEADTDEDKI